MALAALQVTGFFLGLFGMIGSLVATVLPYWETSAHIGTNIVTAAASMKGLWMDCTYQSTGAFQCESFNTILGLPSDLQAARVMMVLSLFFSALAIIVSSVGMQCTVCLKGTSTKNKVAGVGGCLLVTAGIVSIIPFSIKTHQVVQTFFRPNMPGGLKYEMGDCLYLGLASSLLSIIGGSLLCLTFCHSTAENQGYRCQSGSYPYPGRTGMGGMPPGGLHSMAYQTAMNHRTTANSNHTAAAYGHMKPSHRTSVPSYSLTGYV